MVRLPDSAYDPRRVRLLFVGLMVGLLVSELDATLFATAMPTIVADLDGAAAMPWITTGYVLAATIVMPVYGKFGDLFGRRRMFIGALGVFVAGSVIGGLSADMTQLIIGRAVQGLGGGGLLILVQAIVADVVPARRRAPYLSAIGAVFALSAAAGPVLGGWLTEGVGWRWAFWINLPLGAGALVLAAVLLPASRPRSRAGRPDIAGIGTLAIGLVAFVLLISEAGTRYAWTSPTAGGLAAIALTAAVAFVLAERRAAEPIVALGLFRQRNFALATGAGMAGALAVFGVVNYLPTYLQMASGLSATRAGVVMLCLIAGIGTTTVTCAQIVSRTGHYKWLPVAGSGLVALALLLLSMLRPESELTSIGAVLFVLGAGMGCSIEVLVLVAQTSAPARDVGTATAVHQFAREIGVSLGTAFVGTMVTTRLGHLLPAGLTGSGPADLARMTEDTRSTIAAAYDAALMPTFLAVVPFVIVSAVGLAFIHARPLPTTLALNDEPVRRGPDSRSATDDRLESANAG